MKYKFIVDESTGDKVAELLRSEGLDVVSVISQMRVFDDLSINQRTINADRIIVRDVN